MRFRWLCCLNARKGKKAALPELLKAVQQSLRLAEKLAASTSSQMMQNLQLLIDSAGSARLLDATIGLPRPSSNLGFAGSSLPLLVHFKSCLACCTSS